MKLIQNLYNRYIFSMALIRAKIYGLACKTIGSNVYILKGVIIYSPKNVSIGKNTAINIRTILDGSGGLTIGSDVLIGPDCKIFTSNHKKSNANSRINSDGYDRAEVLIQDGAWLGANVIVLPGITIGSGSIIGAGAIVTKSTKNNCIYAGNPAKIIGERS